VSLIAVSCFSVSSSHHVTFHLSDTLCLCVGYSQTLFRNLLLALSLCLSLSLVRSLPLSARLLSRLRCSLLLLFAAVCRLPLLLFACCDTLNPTATKPHHTLSFLPLMMQFLCRRNSNGGDFPRSFQFSPDKPTRCVLRVQCSGRCRLSARSATSNQSIVLLMMGLHKLRRCRMI